jgi:hypothetical protein
MLKENWSQTVIIVPCINLIKTFVMEISGGILFELY